MNSVTDLVDEKSIRQLSAPANFRLGREITAQDGVELIEFGSLKVVAKVQPLSGQKRTVELTSTAKGLNWKCTCTSRKDLFCKHCVAAGLVIRKKAPKSRPRKT